MGEAIWLGQVTCPSGTLVVLDGGCLGMWSGDRSPAEIDPADFGIDDEALAANISSSVDFAVAGPDAAEAARTFERRPMPYHYDVPGNAVDEWMALFAEHCRTRGLDARLEPYPRPVPHRERALRAAREGLPDFIFFGVPAVAVGTVPVDRPFDVVAEKSDGDSEGWKQMTVRIGAAPTATTRSLGDVGVDWARLTFADADALSHWQHEETLDGLADFLFWGGPNADEAASHFGVSHVDTPGDEGSYGWTDLPIRVAWQRGMTIQAWKDEDPGRKLGTDFRPHSHHWQVMRQVRGSDTESGTVTVGGAEILFAMTSWGDGFFPVEADYDAEGNLLAVRVMLAES